MKKNNLLLIGMFLISLYSCQEKTDSTIIETKTNLNIDIPIIAESVDNTKSETGTTEIDYFFSGSGSYSPSNLANSENEIYNVQNIKPESGSIFSFSGIKETDEIYSLKLEWGYKTSIDADYTMQEPVDLLSFEYMIKEGVFMVKMDEVLNKMFNGSNIDENYSFNVKVTGKSNFNLNGVATLEIPVLVLSEAVTAHFTLF